MTEADSQLLNPGDKQSGQPVRVSVTPQQQQQQHQKTTALWNTTQVSFTKVEKKTLFS
jgi:hypothetical protein